MAKRGTLTVPVVGVASSPLTLPQLRKRAEEAIRDAGPVDDRPALASKLKAMTMIAPHAQAEPSAATSLTA